MAYSPLDLGKRARSRALKEIAAGCRASPIQVALAWLVRQDGVIAIPKAGSEAHVHENRAALDLRLTRTDLAALDRGFPPPKEKRRRDAPRQRQWTNRPPARVRRHYRVRGRPRLDPFASRSSFSSPSQGAEMPTFCPCRIDVSVTID